MNSRTKELILQGHPISDFLPYLSIFGNIILMKDMSFSAVLRISGYCDEGISSEEYDYFSSAIKRVLVSMKNYFHYQFVYDRNKNIFPIINKYRKLLVENENIPILSKVLAEDKMKYFLDLAEIDQIKNDELYIVANYKKMLFSDIPIVKLIEFLKKENIGDKKKEEMTKAINELNKAVNELQYQLEGIGMRAKRLDSFGLRNLIYKFLNPTRSIAAPEIRTTNETNATEISQLTYEDIEINKNGFRIGDCNYGIITMKVPPETTYAAMTNLLEYLDVDITIVFNLFAQDKQNEINRLRRRKIRLQDLGRLIKFQREESEEAAGELDIAMRKMISGVERALYTEFIVMVKDKDEDKLNYNIERIIGELNRLEGMEAIQHNYGAFPVFLSALPGNSKEGREKVNLLAENVADMLPIYTGWEGHNIPVCLFTNRRNNLVGFNPVDNSLQAWNVLIVGKSGSGKSFTMNYITQQLLYQEPLLFFIDIGGSYKPLIEILNGQYIEFDINNPFTLNPFDVQLDENGKIPPEKIFLISSIIEQILLEKDQTAVDKLTMAEVQKKIYEVYEKVNDRTPLISDYAKLFKNSDNPLHKDIYSKLSMWIGNGLYADFLDGESNFSFDKGNIMGFDLKGLDRYADLQSIMLLILIDFIQMRMSKTDKWTFVILDEVWKLLKNKTASEYIEEAYRTYRKEKGVAITITQAIEDMIKLPVGTPIIRNSDTKIILGQKGDLRGLQQALNLKDSEIDLISGLEQIKGIYSEIYLISGENKSVCRLRASSKEYWLSTTDPIDRQVRKKYIETYGDFFEALEHLILDYPRGVAAAEG